jgi:hypothetical protein
MKIDVPKGLKVDSIESIDEHEVPVGLMYRPRGKWADVLNRFVASGDDAWRIMSGSGAHWLRKIVNKLNLPIIVAERSGVIYLISHDLARRRADLKYLLGDKS